MNTILWRFIIYPGHEFCRLVQEDSNWHLEGTVVFSHEQAPCRLNYQVTCDTAWCTLEAGVKGWVGQSRVDILLRTGADHHWRLNEVEAPGVEGCTDIDFNFSPSTNTIPIRRLNLAVGETAEVRAAWLRFPSFSLEPLEQRYTRLEESLYRYESGGGQFVADLRVSQAGFVTEYPGAWIAESGKLP